MHDAYTMLHARRRTASGAAANFTYTAADATAGLVPFLNNVTRSPPSRTVRVSLPAGTVWRGSGVLSIASGLTILLQGHGKDGAGNTTLDLQMKNLDLGTMLGDTGRMEFNGMHVTNVRALPRRGCAPASCYIAVCAGLCGILSSSHRRNRVVSRSLAQCRAGFVCLFVCADALRFAATERAHTPSRGLTHARQPQLTTCVFRLV